MEEIKHGKRVVESLEGAMFVDDIRRATGLDERSLRRVLQQLSKNGHISKDMRGLWYLS